MGHQPPTKSLIPPLHVAGQPERFSNTAGMGFVNRCTWAHIVVEVARLLELAQGDLLSPEGSATLEGTQAPAG